MELFGFGDEATGEEFFVSIRKLVEDDVREPLVERLVEVDVAVRATAQPPCTRFGGRSNEDLGAGADGGGSGARTWGNLFLAKVELNPLCGTGVVRTRANRG